MGVQFRISPTTIFNMKIILALFGFFLTASSLPAPFPPCFPFCNSGQTAPTKNNAIHNCKNGQCNPNNHFSDLPGTATSNCVDLSATRIIILEEERREMPRITQFKIVKMVNVTKTIISEETQTRTFLDLAKTGPLERQFSDLK